MQDKAASLIQTLKPLACSMVGRGKSEFQSGNGRISRCVHLQATVENTTARMKRPFEEVEFFTGEDAKRYASTPPTRTFLEIYVNATGRVDMDSLVDELLPEFGPQGFQYRKSKWGLSNFYSVYLVPREFEEVCQLQVKAGNRWVDIDSDYPALESRKYAGRSIRWNPDA